MGKSEYKYVMPPRSDERQRARTSSRAWTEEELEAYAVRYMARFDCTEQRLRSVLTRKLESKSESASDLHASGVWLDRLIDRFKRLGYVNDERYALRLVESLRLKGASTRKIRERLRARGVESGLTAELLLGVNADQDLAAAVTWVRRRKMGAYRRVEPNRTVEQQRQRYQRDLAALARAGFSFDVARRALASSVEDSE